MPEEISGHSTCMRYPMGFDFWGHKATIHNTQLLLYKMRADFSSSLFGGAAPQSATLFWEGGGAVIVVKTVRMDMGVKVA